MEHKIKFNCEQYDLQIKQAIEAKGKAKYCVDKANELLKNVIPKLNSMHLKVSKIYTTGLYPIIDNFTSTASLSIEVKRTNDKFKFIKDRGYTAKGYGKNEKQLYNKADKISKRLEQIFDCRVQVNPYSLEYKYGDNLDEKKILVDFYFT